MLACSHPLYIQRQAAALWQNLQIKMLHCLITFKYFKYFLLWWKGLLCSWLKLSGLIFLDLWFNLSQLVCLLLMGTLNRFQYLPRPFCYVLKFFLLFFIDSTVNAIWWICCQEAVILFSFIFFKWKNVGDEIMYSQTHALFPTVLLYIKADLDQPTSSQQKSCMCSYLGFRSWVFFGGGFFGIILPLHSLKYLTFKESTI